MRLVNLLQLPGCLVYLPDQFPVFLKYFFLVFHIPVKLIEKETYTCLQKAGRKIFSFRYFWDQT